MPPQFSSSLALVVLRLVCEVEFFTIVQNNDHRRHHILNSFAALKTGRRDLPGSNPSRACRPSRSEFSVVYSEYGLGSLKKITTEGTPPLGPGPIRGQYALNLQSNPLQTNQQLSQELTIINAAWVSVFKWESSLLTGLLRDICLVPATVVAF